MSDHKPNYCRIYRDCESAWRKAGDAYAFVVKHGGTLEEIKHAEDHLEACRVKMNDAEEKFNRSLD